MNETETKIKVSISMEREFWERIKKALNALPEIRRDVLLNSWLWSTIGKLEEMPRNSLSKQQYSMWANDFFIIEKIKVNVSFDKELIERLDVTLKEKNVPRGMFLSVFIRSTESWIESLAGELDNPHMWSGNGEPLYNVLFPSPAQAAEVKKQHDELLASFQKFTADDFRIKRK